MRILGVVDERASTQSLGGHQDALQRLNRRLKGTPLRVFEPRMVVDDNVRVVQSLEELNLRTSS